MAAATFDRGTGLNLFTLQITHYIGSNVDANRNLVGKLLAASGAALVGEQASRIPPDTWRRNGGGNRYPTDGRIAVYAFRKPCTRHRSQP